MIKMATIIFMDPLIHLLDFLAVRLPSKLSAQ